MAATALMKSTRMKAVRASPASKSGPLASGLSRCVPRRGPVPGAYSPGDATESRNAARRELRFMDSPIFKQRGHREASCSTSRASSRALPLTSWYQPTRDEAVDETIAGAPQLMKGAGREADVPPLQLRQAAS